MSEGRINYLNRIKKDLELDIEMWTDYVNKSESKTWTKENNVGRSYQARRNKRFGAIHDSRIAEKKEYIKSCQNKLDEINKELEQSNDR
jgi:hypothetical protein